MGRRAIHSAEVATRIAERLHDLRVERGPSIRELARRSGLAPESVSRSERGITEATITNLVRICAGLELPVSEFFQQFEARGSGINADVVASAELVESVGDELQRRIEALPEGVARRYLDALDVLAGRGARSRKKRR